MATAIVVDDAVATFERPMYRPDDAFGMMSVMSAQSTARNVPGRRAEQRARRRSRRHARRDGDRSRRRRTRWRRHA